MSSTATTTTTTTPPVVTPSIKDAYDGFPVKNKDTKPEIDTSKLYGLYTKSTLQAAEGKLAGDVKAVDADKKAKADKEIKDKADNQKAEEEANATPTWKYVVFFPYYAVKFALSTVAGLFNKICSIFGYGEEKKADKPAEQKPADKPATTTTAPKTAEPAKPAAK